MSSIADIRSAWNTGVWTNAAITAITPQIFSYDVLARVEASETEAAHLVNHRTQEIHFLQYDIERQTAWVVAAGGTNQVNHTTAVHIEYYIEADSDGTNYHAAQDDLETIIDTIVAQVGRKWANTVDGWNFGTPTIPSPRLGQINGRDVWATELRLIGFEYTTL